MATSAPMPAPTPIPAFAPVLSSEDEELLLPVAGGSVGSVSEDAVGVDAVNVTVGEGLAVDNGLDSGISGPPGFQAVEDSERNPESLQNFCHPAVISAVRD